MKEFFLKIIDFEMGLPKILKQVNFIFSFEPSPFLMDKIIKNKSSLELVTSPSSGYETSSEKFLYLLYIIWQSLMM